MSQPSGTWENKGIMPISHRALLFLQSSTGDIIGRVPSYISIDFCRYCGIIIKNSSSANGYYSHMSMRNKEKLNT